MNTEPITFAPRVGRSATPPLGAALLACLLLAGAAPAAPADALCGMESRAALKQARDEADKSARWLDQHHADNDKVWHDSNAFVAYRQHKLDECRGGNEYTDHTPRYKLLCGSTWEPDLMQWTSKRDAAKARTEMYYASWYVQADKRNAMDYCLAGKQPRVKYCGYKSEAALAKRAGQLRALLKETNEGIERKEKNIDYYQQLAENSKTGQANCTRIKNTVSNLDNKPKPCSTGDREDVMYCWLGEIKKVWSTLSLATEKCTNKFIDAGKGQGGGFCPLPDTAELCIRYYQAQRQLGKDKAKYIGWELAGFKERVTYIEPELARLYACGAPAK